MDLHEKFIEWAEANGVSLEYREDYQAWYDCWLSGFEQGVIESKALVEKKLVERNKESKNNA